MSHLNDRELQNHLQLGNEGVFFWITTNLILLSLLLLFTYR